MKKQLVIALDGHDGSGKSTLTKALASRLGGTSVQPFSGAAGKALLDAGIRGNAEALITIGTGAIENALSSVPENDLVILDRGWMTVASFVPASDFFFKEWKTWIPTTLCWANMENTLSRLSVRKDEQSEPVNWHRSYLDIYMKLATDSGSPVLRTDLLDIEECLNKLVEWIELAPEKPFSRSH